jgi:hypothetical protein
MTKAEWCRYLANNTSRLAVIFDRQNTDVFLQHMTEFFKSKNLT